MSTGKKRNKKMKKVKFKTITIKLSENQFDSLKMYCNALDITPVRYLKRSISRYLHFQKVKEKKALLCPPNQLNLFEEIF